MGWRLLKNIVCPIQTPEGSEPTVWDGDHFPNLKNRCLSFCSKPTVWDGDDICGIVCVYLRAVPSPLGGMMTESFIRLLVFLQDIVSSEPTGWDDDASA